MATLIKITVLATVLLLATPISASAGNANQGPSWGTVVGAGILGGIIGGATAPPPQQIIVVPERQAPPPANIIVVVPPGYQPPQAQTQAQKWHDALAAHCIGGSFVDGVLTVINACQQPVAVYWGLGNFHGSGEVAFTVPTIVLPAGGTRQIVAATFSYTGDISWTACLGRDACRGRDDRAQVNRHSPWHRSGLPLKPEFCCLQTSGPPPNHKRADANRLAA